MRDSWTEDITDVDSPENAYDVTVTLFVEGKLWTVNSERSEHYTAHRKKTRDWRETAGFTALSARIPRLQQMRVTAIPYQRNGVLADVGSHFPPVKATIDGLVDAGILEDDTPDYVTSITMHAPRRDKTEPEGLLLVIHGRKRLA